MAIGLPDIVGVDLAQGKKGVANDASPKIGAADNPSPMALSTVDANMTDTPISNSGQAVMDASQQANQIVVQQVDAAQKTWLLNASSQHELDAQKLLDTAQRNAAPGQQITPMLQQALTEKTQANLNEVDNPMLSTNYQNEMQRANTQILSQAQSFDFTQRDKQVENNFKQGIGAQQNTLGLMTNVADIEKSFGQMMAGVNQNISTLPLTPDVKLQLQEYARKSLTDAANQSYINLDPKGFLARNTGSPQDAAMNFILSKEGSQAATDSNGAAVKFGINQTANPDVDVKNLTQDQAKQIIQTRYIDKVVTPGMSPQMAMVASDSAVNMGVGKTRELLAQAGGDPQKMIALRRDEYERLAANDPAQYGSSLNGWEKRLDDLQARLPDVNARSMPDQDGNVRQDIGGWLPMQLSSFDQRTGSIQSAQQASVQQDKAQQAQRNAQNTAFNSDFDIALGRGQKTYQDIESAYANGQISPAQRTQYTQKLDEFNGNTLKGMASAQRVQEALGGNAVLDPKNAEDRSAVDRHFEGWLKSQPQPQNDEDKQVLQQKEVALSNQYGMLPKTMVGGLSASLRSSKPEDITNAAGMINQIRQTNPNLLSDIPENDLKGANHIQSLVLAGYTPANAAMAARDELKVSPEVKEFRTQEADTNLKADGVGAMATSAINGQYSSKNPFNSTADVDWSKASVPSDMKSAWNDAYRDEYIRTGNPNTATQTATDLIAKTYQRTDVGVGPGGASTRWMQNAPEQFYAAPVKVDQSKWMNEQLQDDVRHNTLDPDAYSSDNLQLIPSGKSNAQGLPTYNVWTVRNGATVPIQTRNGPMEWYPDWNNSKEIDRFKDREYRAKVKAETPIGQAELDPLETM